MNELEQVLLRHQHEFKKVVDFNPATDKLCRFNFSATNSELNENDIEDTEKLSKYINDKINSTASRYGIGGYNENRILYSQAGLFDGDEPRTIHLGTDIWGVAGTRVYAPLGGTVHSFANNKNLRDYGATVILQHQLDTTVFFTLYGHLSLDDLVQLKEGKYISRGEVIGHFGKPEENGNWPPHLHFQIIKDMRINRGDYPGVSSVSESEKYLAICPDADLVLNMMKFSA